MWCVFFVACRRCFVLCCLVLCLFACSLACLFVCLFGELNCLALSCLALLCVFACLRVCLLYVACSLASLLFLSSLGLAWLGLFVRLLVFVCFIDCLFCLCFFACCLFLYLLVDVLLVCFCVSRLLSELCFGPCLRARTKKCNTSLNITTKSMAMGLPSHPRRPESLVSSGTGKRCPSRPDECKDHLRTCHLKPYDVQLGRISRLVRG